MSTKKLQIVTPIVTSINGQTGDVDARSDWNQNDATQPDYVKNRPFYAEDPVETILLEEQAVTFTDGESDTSFNFKASPEDINHIKVTWDGTEYICIPQIYSNRIKFGNKFLVNNKYEDTGEPFYYDGEYFYTESSTNSHQIKVSKLSNKVIKIKPNYIPNSNIRNGTGFFSIVEGSDTTASGVNSHAEGQYTTASGRCSHAEGDNTIARGDYSHAEGSSTTASGVNSHAECSSTTASGDNSHAEGFMTKSSGICSHAEGSSTTASGDYSHVEGKYNIEDTANKYAHIVGNGTSETSRSNAHTLDWNGVGWFKDSVKVGGSSQDDSNAKTLATTDYVDTTVSGKVDKVDGKGLSTNDYTTTEKNKLAGIEAGANNYSLPVATSTSLGGVKSGTDITVDSSGNVSVNDDSHNHIISNIDNLQSTLDSKVDSVDGKGLSTNDYTTAEKNKLAGIDTGANKTIVDSALSSTSTNPVQNKVVNTALAGKSDTSHTHTLNNLDGTLGASKGGTGADLSGAAANAVVCKASSGQNLATVSTAKGAFYATDANATPKFGTLPIAEGGAPTSLTSVNTSYMNI